MKCENCGKSCPTPTMARLWNEYRVGDIGSSDRFYLCQPCDNEVDPIEVWAEKVTVTQVKV